MPLNVNSVGKIVLNSTLLIGTSLGPLLVMVNFLLTVLPSNQLIGLVVVTERSATGILDTCITSAVNKTPSCRAK